VAAMLAVSGSDSVPLLMEEGADEMEQARAWKAVDSVRVSADLSLAADQLLRLLRRVDRRGTSTRGPPLQKAIPEVRPPFLVCTQKSTFYCSSTLCWGGGLCKYEHCWLVLGWGTCSDMQYTP